MEAVSEKNVPNVVYDPSEIGKISDNPFFNLTRAIDDINTEQGRLRINVSMFGHSTSVDL
jgi:transcription antitermination factor NusG